MSAIDPITQFYNRLGRYPGNNKQWWLSKAPTDDATRGLKVGDFDPEILDKLFSGNMRAPRGHFTLQAFNKDRSAVSGVESLTAEVTKERPPTIAFFSGRVWYGCNSNVYFSQVLTDKYKAGLCHQEADPTSEEISDIIATDGGVIPIPEAHKIIKLLPMAGGVLVFAQNGVWFVTGTSSGFTATDISVNKVSPIGCRSPRSVIETESDVYWWSDIGIMGMQQSSGQFGPIPGKFEKANITEQTVQALYNAVPANVRSEVKGVFDPKANVIMWLYRDTDVGTTQFNRVLIFNVTLSAFYPWKFSNMPSNTPYIKGLYWSDRTTTYDLPTDIDPTQIEFLTMKSTAIRIAQTKSKTFSDWATEGGVAYDSYVETGFELFNDAMRSKNITYLFAYFRRTETSYSAITGLDDPSSCYLTTKWDWSSATSSNKWTTPVQVYRVTRLTFSPDTGFGQVITKNKIRGNGKAIQFRFGTNEIGRNFDLQGWSVAVTGNTSP